MKFKSFLLLTTLSLLLFSCADDLTDVGVSIQPKSDEILIGTDTFHVDSKSVNVDYIYTRQDSFLLGTFYSEKFGTTQADILAQVICPVGFTYPEGAVPDSALVVIYYNSWFGDSFSPMDINIYEMNKSTFSYAQSYKSNLDYSLYSDKSIKLGQRIATAMDADSTDYSNSPFIFKLTDDFKNRFFKDSNYSSENQFLNFFKGLYITTNFGTSTLINVIQIDLEYYYHYTYVTKNSSGVDTTITVNNVVTFPANSEVRQINRFLHPDKGTADITNDQVNYIASPANLNTVINMPLKSMKEQMDTKVVGKKLSLNSAVLNIEAVDVADSTLAVPTVSYLLLIKEDSIDNFFKNNKLPDDKYAILGQLTATQEDSDSEYTYSYTFDCASLIANQLKLYEMPVNGMLPLRLIPVTVETNSDGTTTAVKHSYKMSGVSIRSGKNTESPMRINMVYSGF